MKKICFLVDLQYPELWKDGLWAAIQLLKKEYDIKVYNLQVDDGPNLSLEFDMIIGWGAFGSPVDEYLSNGGATPVGLCIGGTAHEPTTATFYDCLFYETKWYRRTYLKEYVQMGGYAYHAFGVNTDIYRELGTRSQGDEYPKVIDYITVGAFSLWKRQHLLSTKPGVRLAVGEIQKGNRTESLQIINTLLEDGVGVMDMVHPNRLAELYNISATAFIPCELHGGGERAVLEARACGCNVEVLYDNPKLKELAESEIYDHHYYAAQLRRGIEETIARDPRSLKE